MATKSEEEAARSTEGNASGSARGAEGAVLSAARGDARCGAVAAVVAIVVAVVATRSGGGGSAASAGLPNTPDYHSLLVSTTNPQKLVLGTHNGLYVCSDGGRHWHFDALSGNDAMNLARPAGTLYAAVAGHGLYRSRDGGRSFAPASREVGGNVMALVVLSDGRILAGDMRQGLLESSDGGASWKERLRAQLMGLAVNPRDPKRVLAAGAGIALSSDAGRTWRSVLDLPDGVGPIAWSQSDPNIAYAVAFNRTLYRSGDSGESWQPVEGS